VCGLALGSMVLGGAAGLPWSAGVVAGAVLGVGGAIVVTAPSPERRERGWEVEAVGVAVLAASWLGAMSAAGLTATGSR
jgi:hypothetical protein